MFENEILKSRVWRILARHPDHVPPEFAEDKGLLKVYVNWVEGQTKKNQNMGLYFDNNSDSAKLRMLVVHGLDNMSSLGGWSNIFSTEGRLIGFLLSETPNALAEEGRKN